MTARIVTEPHFTGLTVFDSRGATLTIERNSNAVGAWIAPPGDNDGFPVILDDADRQQVAAFLAPEVADQLVAARAMCDELRDRNEKLTADSFNAGVKAAADAIERHAESIGWYESSGVWADAIEKAREAVTRR